MDGLRFPMLITSGLCLPMPTGHNPATQHTHTHTPNYKDDRPVKLAKATTKNQPPRAKLNFALPRGISMLRMPPERISMLM